MRLPDGAVRRARAVFAAVGPVPDDAVIEDAIMAALRREAATAKPRSGNWQDHAPHRYLTREQIRQVTCPQCHAGPGEVCKGRGKTSHFVRMERAQRELPRDADERITGQHHPDMDAEFDHPPWADQPALHG